MIELILADDHDVVRQALAEVLEKRGGYHVLAEANNGQRLLELLQSHQPDLVIMDVSMPVCDGIEALTALKDKGGKTPPVLILSANEDSRSVREALKAGAQGYMPKNAGIEELVFAISSIITGKKYVSPSVTHLLVGDSSDGNGGETDPVKLLTTREIEILTLLAEGYDHKQIGKKLHISQRTVDTHRSNILKKLEAKNNVDLVKIAIRSGLIDL